MTYYVCHEHKKAWDNGRAFSGHWTGQHPGQPHPPEETQIDELPEGYQVAETKPKHKTTTTTVYGPSVDANVLLEEILNEHPGLPEEVVKEVMSWTRYQPTLHPNEVSWLLQQMSNVAKGAPALIQQKYSLALANLRGPTPGGVTATPSGGPSPGGMIPTYQGGGGVGGILGSQPSENAGMAELRQRVESLHEDLEKVISHLDEKERQETEVRGRLSRGRSFRRPRRSMLESLPVWKPSTTLS